MAWTAPTNPVAGTVITVAYAIANYVNNLIWLRGLTGNADPPGSNYTIRSTSTSATDWSKVTTDLIADLAVTNGKLAANDIDANTKLAAGSVTVAKMAADSVGASQIIAGSVGTPELGVAAVTNANIGDGQVTTAKLLDANVTVAKMAANSVDSAQIVNGSLDPGHFAAQAVQAAAIADGNVSLVKMAANSVGTSQIVDGAVTTAKLTVIAALSNTQVGSLALTTSNQTLAIITCATAGTYIVHASVLLFTTTTAGDTGQSLTAELAGPAGVFGTLFKWFTGATAVDQNVVQAQTQLIALTGGQTVTLRAKKSGGTGTSGAISGTLVAERIAA